VVTGERSPAGVILADLAGEGWPSFSHLSSDACWPWPGSVDRDGYGKFRQGMAHRAAYIMAFGSIPPGLEMDHVCHSRDNACAGGLSCQHRRCVNASHLEAVTHAENVRRSKERDRCSKGHLLDPVNTYRAPAKPGARVCRACRRARYVAAHPGAFSRERGVSWAPEKGKWRTRIVLGGRRRSLGYFDTRGAAVAAATAARLRELPYATD
jgi:hypothetical protein